MNDNKFEWRTRDWIWTIIILVSIIVILIVLLFANQEELRNYFSFTANFVSIILAIVAIIISTIQSNSAQSIYNLIYKTIQETSNKVDKIDDRINIANQISDISKSLDGNEIVFEKMKKYINEMGNTNDPDEFRKMIENMSNENRNIRNRMENIYNNLLIPLEMRKNINWEVSFQLEILQDIKNQEIDTIIWKAMTNWHLDLKGIEFVPQNQSNTKVYDCVLIFGEQYNYRLISESLSSIKDNRFNINKIKIASNT